MTTGDDVWGFHSIPMYVASLAAALAIAATPLFRHADTPPSDAPGRIGTIDGLRGILALSVYLQHASLTRQYVATGTWRLGASRFYDAVAIGAVAMFFMITGYLFWGKALRDGGRVPVTPLLLGRVFRIGPTYAVAFVAVLVGVALETNLTLEVPVRSLLREIAGWAALGIVPEGPINGDARAWMLLVGVTWSLRWEWGFYLALPLLARVLATSRKRSRIAAIGTVPLIVAATHLTGRPEANLLIAFATGVLAATLPRPRRGKGIDGALSVAVVFLIALALDRPGFHTGDGSIRVVPALLLGMAFLLIVSGASLFGLLTCRAAHRLGDVSYPIYLLQGLVLVPLRTTAPGRFLLTANPCFYWLTTIAGALALIGLATAVHVIVERPGIALGRAVVRRKRSGVVRA